MSNDTQQRPTQQRPADRPVTEGYQIRPALGPKIDNGYQPTSTQRPPLPTTGSVVKPAK